MAIQTEPAITINNLSKIYNARSKEPIKAVDQLNLDIKHGQVFGFLGANGAGKTTTIKMMCGLVTPTSGDIYLNGYHVHKKRSQAMRQIGAVLEGTRNIYWRLTAMENILYFGRLKGVGGRDLKENANRLLAELDLWDRRNDKIRTFSRGMQQKVAIACALIADPPIVLLDEPTLGLDVEAALTVKNWILSLAQERQKTIILTTHHLQMAQQVCDHVAIIRKGQLVANDETATLLSGFRDDYVEIKVCGQLPSADHDHYSDQWRITASAENTLILSGPMTSQDALYQTLNQLRNDGLQLVSVKPVQPELEELFIQLMNKRATGEIPQLELEVTP